MSSISFHIHGQPFAWEFFFELPSGEHITDGEIHPSYEDCLDAAKPYAPSHSPSSAIEDEDELDWEIAA